MRRSMLPLLGMLALLATGCSAGDGTRPPRVLPGQIEPVLRDRLDPLLSGSRLAETSGALDEGLDSSTHRVAARLTDGAGGSGTVSVRVDHPVVTRAEAECAYWMDPCSTHEFAGSTAVLINRSGHGAPADRSIMLSVYRDSDDAMLLDLTIRQSTDGSRFCQGGLPLAEFPLSAQDTLALAETLVT
ncbi:hypothetical protein [Amycolatopsis cihanbeyliensis]|uniref:Lipoprotein n=1 Tax=Amycolatopsis cihanbeyliensis TaxID=1128664 RepID=A0A542DGN0_AMYCI|nr:hypothetical protein [Amycolatopsis cihanbeyliensis]TQJ02233.1 hypothetical protein FB471_1955 [Amycolatopsis cihanbeyliensis]